MDVDALLRHVDLAFEETGAGTPGWPDPHPDRRPRQEEYSRVSDAGRYRILDARVLAWVRALESAGLAQSEQVPAEPWIAPVRPPASYRVVRRITPTRAGGLSVLVAGTLVEGESFGVDVGLVGDGSSPVYLDSVPDCGCDACDSGSADLLEVLDGWVLTIARGGVVHARLDGACVSRTLHGWQGSGRGDPSWLGESLPVPTGVERWAGASWG